MGKRVNKAGAAPPRLSAEAEHSIEFFMRPSDGTVPSLETFAAWPNKVAKKLLPVLAAVAEAPPTKFSGGGKWEAMHGVCTGMYEVRAKVNGRHYRLFCVLDLKAENSDLPLLTVIDADSKPDGSAFPHSRYIDLSELRDEYFSPDSSGRNVRSLAPARTVEKYISKNYEA